MCFAHATGDELNVDVQELDTARWFTREEIRNALTKSGIDLRGPVDLGVGFGIPGPIAIAHHIIKAWSER